MKGEVKHIKYAPGTFAKAVKFDDNGKVISVDEKILEANILIESPWMNNKVLSSPSCGIQLFLDRIFGITTYDGIIGHADMGDDTTPVNPMTDTGCLNPLVRASLAAQSVSGNQRTFRFFFANALTPDDTYNEFSMMTDGDITLGSGQGFNRIVMTIPLVKATGEDHTVVCRVTGSVV